MSKSALNIQLTVLIWSPNTEHRTSKEGQPLVRVKICGIRTMEEAQWAFEAGADALGFVFHPMSKRAIEPEKAKEIIGRLPPFLARVGVFVDRSFHAVKEIAGECRLTAIQLHGRENPADYQNIRLPIIKALAPAEDDFAQENLRQTLTGWQGIVQAILLDSVQAGQFGGTGTALPWEQPVIQKSVAIIKHSGFPVILAGGLKPENVSQGIRMIRPYAVDVSSGVENRVGKDPELIRAFIRKVNST